MIDKKKKKKKIDMRMCAQILASSAPQGFEKSTAGRG